MFLFSLIILKDFDLYQHKTHPINIGLIIFYTQKQEQQVIQVTTQTISETNNIPQRYVLSYLNIIFNYCNGPNNRRSAY